MATNAYATLQQLERLNDTARPVAARLLVENKKLDLNGFTLYAYHTVPVVLAEKVARSIAGAETRVKLRWSKLNGVQRGYWVLKTAELVKGSAKPLHVRTLREFTETKLPAHTFEASSESDSDSGHDDSSDDETEDIRERERGAGARTFSEDDADKLPASVADISLETMERRKVQGQLEYPNLESVLNTLDIMPGGRLKEAHLRAIAQSLAPSGQTLFEHYAWALACPLNDRETRDERMLRVARVWNMIPPGDKKFWHARSGMIRSGLENHNYGVLDHLRITGRPNPQYLELYTKRITAALRYIQENALTAGLTALNPVDMSMSRMDSSFRIMIPTPMLDVLCNGKERFGTKEDVIIKITQTLKSRFTRYQQPTLQIRHSGVRINYDWRDRGVTGLVSRLLDAANERPTTLNAVSGCADVKTSFESLLRPLLLTRGNGRALVELGALYMPEEERSQYSAEVGSCIAWLDPILRDFKPLEPSKAWEVVAAIMDELGDRATATDSKHILLRQPSALVDVTYTSKVNAEAFSLRDYTHGFARQLHHCFECDGLTSDQYEDLLEQRLYALRCYDRNLIPVELESQV